MAMTLTWQKQGVAGNRRWTRGTGVIDTYTAGGFTFTARGVLLSIVDDVEVYPEAGYVFVATPSTRTIQAYREVNDGLGAIKMQEVDTGVNMSAVTFRWRAEGC